MKKTVKFLTIVLCAVIALTALTVSASAVTGGGISVSTSTVKPNDTFNVKITVPAMEDADTASIRVEFDSTAFEVTEWSPSITNSMSNSGNGFFTVSSANASRAIKLTDGVELSAKLKVRKNVTNGSYIIKLTSASLSYVLDNGYESKELWEPTTKQVTVKVTGGTADVTPASSETEQSSNSTWNDESIPSVSNTSDTSKNTDNTNNTTTNSKDNTTSTADTSTVDDEDDEPPADTDDPDEEIFDADDPEDDEIFDGDDPEDGDDGFSLEEGEKTSVSEVKLKPVLGGISAGQVKIYTKKGFFENDTEITLTNTVGAQNECSSALKGLGLGRHQYYPFDISVYDTVLKQYISTMNSGYVDITMPVPDKLTDAGSDLAVFHVVSGKGVRINSSVISIDGIPSINFRVSSFSPFMIVDMVGEVSGNEDTNVYKVGNTSTSSNGSVNGGTTGGSSGDTKGGPLNPKTGVAAAVAIPSALIGCAFLSRRIVKKRKRTRKYIEP